MTTVTAGATRRSRTVVPQTQHDAKSKLSSAMRQRVDRGMSIAKYNVELKFTDKPEGHRPFEGAHFPVQRTRIRGVDYDVYVGTHSPLWGKPDARSPGEASRAILRRVSDGQFSTEVGLPKPQLVTPA